MIKWPFQAAMLSIITSYKQIRAVSNSTWTSWFEHGFGLIWQCLQTAMHIDIEKPALSGHSKIDKIKILMTNGSLMKVESIAECILQYFWPAFSDNLSYKPIFGLFMSGRLRQVLLHFFRSTSSSTNQTTKDDKFCSIHFHFVQKRFDSRWLTWNIWSYLVS